MSESETESTSWLDTGSVADLEGETELTFQCAAAVVGVGDCSHEPEEIELDAPARLDDEGRIHLPGRPLECPDCGEHNYLRFNGIEVRFVR
jgi:hypothetical protein